MQRLTLIIIHVFFKLNIYQKTQLIYWYFETDKAVVSETVKTGKPEKHTSRFE